MAIKTLVASALLALAPTLTLAMGCEHGHIEQQVMSCAEGMALDSETGKCVAHVTG